MYYNWFGVGNSGIHESGVPGDTVQYRIIPGRVDLIPASDIIYGEWLNANEY